MLAEIMIVNIRTGSGTIKEVVVLTQLTEPRRKRTHNGDGWFTYQRGWDAFDKCYETKSRGGGWRRQLKGDKQPDKFNERITND